MLCVSIAYKRVIKVFFSCFLLNIIFVHSKGFELLFNFFLPGAIISSTQIHEHERPTATTMNSDENSSSSSSINSIPKIKLTFKEPLQLKGDLSTSTVNKQNLVPPEKAKRQTVPRRPYHRKNLPSPTDKATSLNLPPLENRLESAKETKNLLI